MMAEIIVYFLGTDERKNTQLYPIRQLVTVGYIDNVLHNHVAHFKDESERQEFLYEYMRIKNTIASFDRLWEEIDGWIAPSLCCIHFTLG